MATKRQGDFLQKMGLPKFESQAAATRVISFLLMKGRLRGWSLEIKADCMKKVVGDFMGRGVVGVVDQFRQQFLWGHGKIIAIAPKSCSWLGQAPEEFINTPSSFLVWIKWKEKVGTRRMTYHGLESVVFANEGLVCKSPCPTTGSIQEWLSGRHPSQIPDHLNHCDTCKERARRAVYLLEVNGRLTSQKVDKILIEIGGEVVATQG